MIAPPGGEVSVSAQPGKLKTRPQFLHVAGRGRKVAVPGLVLQVLDQEPAATPRAGFTVTKKVGNAVVRNRTRRILREALRAVARKEDLAAVDIVLIGRDGTRTRGFANVVEDLRRALRKGGALRP
nr:ribonuclease P protein component [Acidomonas methanolica]